MKAIRIGICTVIAFAAGAFGGIEWWAVGIAEIGAAGLFLLWGILALRQGRADIAWNWIYLPMLGIAALSGIQRLFAMSAYPYATNVELLKGVTYLVLCFLAAESFRITEDRVALTWFLVTLSFVIAVFGIVQRFSFDGRLYWLIPLPDGAEPFGPFVNRDHFAGFVELTAPLGLAMLLNGAYRRDKIVLLTLFTTMPIVALLLSSSRGGIVGFVVATLVVVALSRPMLARRKQMLGVLTLGILAGVFAFWLGANATIGRFERMSPTALTNSQRLAMDRDTWRIFLDHPWMGTGLGTLETVYPKYASFYDGRVVDHAHNDYLEFLAETGGAGGVLGAGFIALLLWGGIRNWRSAADAGDRAFLIGALAACAALLVHSGVDFNLHIPSNALLFLLLTTLACAKIPFSEIKPNQETCQKGMTAGV